MVVDQRFGVTAYCIEVLQLSLLDTIWHALRWRISTTYFFTLFH